MKTREGGEGRADAPGPGRGGEGSWGRGGVVARQAVQRPVVVGVVDRWRPHLTVFRTQMEGLACDWWARIWTSSFSFLFFFFCFNFQL